MKRKTYSKILETLAENIKFHRKAKGYTQEEMAEFGFNYRHYQKIESGKYSPNLQSLYRVAEALDVSLDELFRNI